MLEKNTENSALPSNYILKHFKKKTVILNCNNISQLLSLLYFWSNKCSLCEHEISFKSI